ncbi:MAG: hypothetical protein U0457_05400 [Candidatus Sericytochromatia bacterium]
MDMMGLLSFNTGLGLINPAADPLSSVEVVDLFKTEKVDKMQT